MKKNRIKALLATAYADGFFDSRELYVINSRARDLGLSGEEILELIRSPKAEVSIYPVTVEERIHFLYDLMRVILADEKIEEDEKSIFYKYLNELEFEPSIFDDLFHTMIDSVKSGDNVEYYIDKYFDDEI